MTAIEGRVAKGLDEFMLRLGHLKLLCRVAKDSGGTRSRLEREFGAVLGESIAIPVDCLGPVARYLRQKRLCPLAEASLSSLGGLNETGGERFRYPELTVNAKQDVIRSSRNGGGELKIRRQDLWLADPRVASPVGAIPVNRGKGASKTGVSHIVDWAIILNAMTPGCQLTPYGHLLGALRDTDDSFQNPYVIGLERIIFGFLVCESDFDVFAEFTTILAASESPIKKQDGLRLFRESLKALSDAADHEHRLSIALQVEIRRLFKEVAPPDDRRGSSVRDPTASTAWHRASSRLETYVDLGLLQKNLRDEAERFHYVYYVTDIMHDLRASLIVADSMNDWLSAHLVTFFGGAPAQDTLEPDDILPLIPALASAMRRPPSLLPIDALTLGLAMLFAERRRFVAFGSIRSAIEEMARRSPGRARLSRGSSGTRAEFVSVEIRDIQDAVPDTRLFY
jgi:hypothetical protein